MMSRPGTEASKQAAVGVPHSAPAPAPVAVISTRRITYLKKVPIRRSNQFNVLAWWEMSSGEYPKPKLSHMARDILAVPASTVASESAFSTGSRVLSYFRSRMTSEIVEALVCLQDWITASTNAHRSMNSVYVIIMDLEGEEGDGEL